MSEWSLFKLAGNVLAYPIKLYINLYTSGIGATVISKY